MVVTARFDTTQNGWEVYWRCHGKKKIRIPCSALRGDKSATGRVAHRLRARIEQAADRSDREVFFALIDDEVAEELRGMDEEGVLADTARRLPAEGRQPEGPRPLDATGGTPATPKVTDMAASEEDRKEPDADNSKRRKQGGRQPTLSWPTSAASSADAVPRADVDMRGACPLVAPGHAAYARAFHLAACKECSWHAGQGKVMRERERLLGMDCCSYCVVGHELEDVRVDEQTGGCSGFGCSTGYLMLDIDARNLQLPEADQTWTLNPHYRDHVRTCKVCGYIICDHCMVNFILHQALPYLPKQLLAKLCRG